MNKKPTDDQFDSVVYEFIKTYTAFEKAAKKLMSIMESMNKKRNQELEALSGESQRIYEFLVQIMDDSGQIGENCLGIKCVADKKNKSSKY